MGSLVEPPVLACTCGQRVSRPVRCRVLNSTRYLCLDQCSRKPVANLFPISEDLVKSDSRSEFTDANIRAFAARLKEHALTLSDAERHALCQLLLRAMEPLDRFRYRSISDLLSPEEEAVLASYEKKLNQP